MHPVCADQHIATELLATFQQQGYPFRILFEAHAPRADADGARRPLCQRCCERLVQITTMYQPERCAVPRKCISAVLQNPTLLGVV